MQHLHLYSLKIEFSEETLKAFGREKESLITQIPGEKEVREFTKKRIQRKDKRKQKEKI